MQAGKYELVLCNICEGTGVQLCSDHSFREHTPKCVECNGHGRIVKEIIEEVVSTIKLRENYYTIGEQH